MANRSPFDQSLLEDLVNRRMEAPQIEYKRWMPLTQKEERANIARHICALANLGGGYLIFGFEDDGQPAEPYPDDLAAYGQDAINAIGERHLEPQPHCEVHYITAASGKVYPVVRVPAHGLVPVCAKRDGPHDSKGQPTGIRAGVHYIRVAGPRSVPIDSPGLWRDLLHRCVLSERATLLNSIGQLFDKVQPGSAGTNALDEWLHLAVAAWQEVSTGAWPITLADNYTAFGFRLLRDDGQAPKEIELPALKDAIRNASIASGSLLKHGCAVFELGWGSDQREKVMLVEGQEGYEMRVDTPAGNIVSTPAFWRVTTQGSGTDIQGLPEDSSWARDSVQRRGRTRSWLPGQRLSPIFQITTMAERLAFVLKFAEAFADATRCELVVEFAGLAGRTLDETDPGIHYSLDRSSAVNSRRQRVSVGLTAFAADPAQAAGALLGPIFRLFDSFTVNMLLSFALFEREVTAERIRDKFAASRAKGLWMGGSVPLGYRVQDRKLVIDESEADTVRHIFRRYGELGSGRALLAELREQHIVTKVQQLSDGRTRGGMPFTPGGLFYLLKNRTYIGEAVHKGMAYPGEHDAIIDVALWDAVQSRIAAGAVERGVRRNSESHSLLAGIIVDGHGRRMTPSHANKSGRRYRYYITHGSAIVDDRASWRVAASDAEAAVIACMKEMLCDRAAVRALAQRADAQALSAALDRADQAAARLSDSYHRRVLVHRLVMQVRLLGEQIEIDISRSALLQMLGLADDQREVRLTRRIAWTRVRIGKQIKLVLGNEQSNRDEALVKLLAEAQTARALVMQQPDRTIQETAVAAGRCRKRLAKLVMLSWLSPEIVETILAGAQPTQLTVKSILAIRLPLDWSAQKSLLLG